ncbi:MAG: filamentous hemagglutinin N-terminal domain-containing protein [Nostoc sp.]|uniref:two-partner secretion domain-containing protein n=1 Tax=Nostoc sp. TaxID=1180 RepID=UPI002FFD1814
MRVVPFLLILTTGFFTSGMLLPATAQVRSDGTTNTIVNKSGNNFNIINGINQGNNLFHSFSNFSVPTGGSATFDLTNTPNITTIFSRVTGGNVSNINGLIQTLNGNNAVSLFLMNPAGIVFGKDASLNISGSFVGTTANSIKFFDGTEFSAVNANAKPLLTMSVPIGLQMGQNAAPMQVQSNLTAGLDLSLEAGRLDLQGQLVAGRDITLKAQNTVQIRDTVTTPFLAQAGRNLTIQGNQSIDILALNQPNAALQSRGNLSLISNGNISGDAHFLSGGNVLFQTLTGAPGKFVSQFDPVIYANGDVVFGDYMGAALKVEATGSIEGGNITIVRPDATIPVSDPDFITLTTQPAVILRAGVPSIATSNLPQLGVGDINTNFTTGTVAGLPPGSISISKINTSNATGQNGGSITLTAQGDITTESLNSSSSSIFGNSGNGGAITVSTTNGNLSVNTGVLSAATSIFGNSGNGGAITLSTTNGNLSLNGGVSSITYSLFGQSSGNGGAITLSTTNGNLSLNGGVYSDAFSVSGKSGNGGAITLSTNNGNLSNQGDIYSPSFTTTGNTGNGGAITLSTNNGNLSNQGDIYSQSFTITGNSGNGGDISLSTNNGSLSNHGDLYSFSFSKTTGNSGNGGNIAFSTNNGNLSNQADLYSFSTSKVGNSGNGGDISLAAQNGSILGKASSLYTFSIAPQGTASDGGSVTLDAQNQISGLTLLTTSSSAKAGDVSIVGRGDLAIADTTILTSKQVTVNTPFTGEIPITVDGTGRSGDVNISSAGNLTLSNSSIQSDTKGNDPAGNVTLTSPGLIRFDNSQIASSTSNIGQAGDININAPSVSVTDNAKISAATQGSGRGGNISITTGQLTLQDGVELTASSSGSGRAGNLIIAADEVTLNQGSRVTSNTSSSGAAGEVKLTIPNGSLSLLNGSEISTSTQGTGDAGNVGITANTVTVQGSKISSQSSGSGNSGLLDLTTSQLTLADNAELSTASSGSGKAGNISVQAQQVTLGNGSQITSRSQGTGDGGTIQVEAGSLLLNGGAQINAQTTSGNGGNLILSLGDMLQLWNQSLLSAAAGGNGNGGNITISSPFIIGLGNSDIVANAFQGNGGNIEITTNGIFGLKYRDHLTNDNDITASSQFGVNGTVQINHIGVDPTSGSVELPVNVTDPSQQIASGCAANQGSSFVATGRGGIPQNPTQQIGSDVYDGLRLRPWSDVRDISAYRTTQALQAQIPKSPEVLVQATGWRRNADGKIEIFADKSPLLVQQPLTCAAVIKS